LLIYDKGEHHSVEALDKSLVFISFLREMSENIPPEKAGGLLGRSSE
jgi:hypothetical protein